MDLEHPDIGKIERTGYLDYPEPDFVCECCDVDMFVGGFLYDCEGSKVCEDCYKEYAMSKLEELSASELAEILGDSWEVV